MIYLKNKILWVVRRYAWLPIFLLLCYEYKPGFCKLLHYNGLWRVECQGVPGHFKKVKMACTCMKDGCGQDCEVFETVADVKDPSMEWHM